MALYRMLLLMCLLVIFDWTFGVLVQTNHGPIQGNVTTYNGQSLKTFLGIPYAKPPIGQLRFKPPQDPEPWTEPLIATEYSAICMQRAGISGPKSEDCLYLDVFVPVTDDSGSLPVMVWIHGGALVIGSSQVSPPHGLALFGEVIVVTINYRLDVFGFFATGSDAVEGNIGVLDQVAALKWVKDNIASFGGDKDRITVFGESAGSWSISVHIISPLSAGLFSRAIGQSGSVHNYHLETDKERLLSAKTFVGGLNCASEDEKVMVRCLQNKTADEVMSQALLTPFTSSPCPLSVGGSFLPLQPEDMWTRYKPSADLLIGVNSEESSALLEGFKQFLPPGAYDDLLQNGVSQGDVIFDLMVGGSLVLFPSEIPSSTLNNTITAQYFGNLEKDDKIGTLRAALDAFADRFFISPSLLTATSTVASGRDVYTYYFSEVTKTQALGAYFFPYVAALDSGAGHATELSYIMGQTYAPNMPYSWYDLASEVDRNLSRSMMNAWVSFAKTGKPLFLSSDGTAVEWPKYQNDDKKYVEFRSPVSVDSIKTNLRFQAESFWNVLLPAVIDQYRRNEATTAGPGHSTTECPGLNQSNDMALPTHQRMMDITLLLLIAVVSILARM